MQDEPSGVEIIESVAAFIRGTLIPLLPSRAAFEARVAANALDIAIREWRLSPASNLIEVEHLKRLLTMDGSLHDLTAELAKRIAQGQIDTDDPEVSKYLWQSTLAKLAVDQPNYESYKRAMMEREPIPEGTS